MAPEMFDLKIFSVDSKTQGRTIEYWDFAVKTRPRIYGPQIVVPLKMKWYL
jgi:hypothetical protein